MMNQTEKTVLVGISGTSVMTLSSYFLSVMASENFREPEHLEVLIGRIIPHLSKKAKVIAGWGAHFAMGLIFAAIYVELWEKKQIKHNLKNGLILGLASGVLGLLIWKGTFKSHPLPPLINFDHYYLQRIPAHVVFALTATVTYRLFEMVQGEKKQSLN